MTSDKDDLDLDDLMKRAMQEATPQADDARRAENIARAKKNFAPPPGSGMAARQSPERPQKRGVLTGGFHMLKPQNLAAE